MSDFLCSYVYVLSHSVVPDSLQPLWTVACQAPLSMRFSRQGNIGVGWLFLLQGFFPTQGSNLCLPHLLRWQADFLPLCHLGSPSSVHSPTIYGWSLILSELHQLPELYFSLCEIKGGSAVLTVLLRGINEVCVTHSAQCVDHIKYLTNTGCYCCSQ